MRTEDKIYGLIAQADNIHDEAIRVFRALPSFSREVVKEAVEQILIEKTKEASNSLKEASDSLSEVSQEAIKVCNSLRKIRFNYILLIIITVFLCISIIWLAFGYYIQSRQTLINKLNIDIEIARNTLFELEQYTWGIDLVTLACGSRGIALPIGQRYEDRTTRLTDGRSIAIIQ
jgi:hypothetical protein